LRFGPAPRSYVQQRFTSCAPVLEWQTGPPCTRVTFPGRPGPTPGRGTFFYTIDVIMTKAKKKQPRKRGPKEERLVIREDPQTALAKLLKKPTR
jgi:hypothetical protein